MGLNDLPRGAAATMALLLFSALAAANADTPPPPDDADPAVVSIVAGPRGIASVRLSEEDSDEPPFVVQRDPGEAGSSQLRIRRNDTDLATITDAGLRVHGALDAEGDLNARGGSVSMAPQESLPSCVPERRGTMRYVRGPSALDSDMLYVCMHRGRGSYVWVPLAYEGVSAGDAVCGNNLLEAGEECDNGQFNSDEAGAHCRLDCTKARCGDGVTDPPLEACDPGLTALCKSDCSAEMEVPTSCKHLFEQDPGAGNGLYELTFDGSTVEAYCEMSGANGGGWTAILDPLHDVRPSFTALDAIHGGTNRGAPVVRYSGTITDPSSQYTGRDTYLEVEPSNSINRSGRGIDRAAVTGLAWPAFTEVRVRSDSTQMCIKGDEEGRDIAHFDWTGATAAATQTDWLLLLFQHVKGTSSHNICIDPIPADKEVMPMSLAASASGTIHVGQECGTTDCSQSHWAQFKSIYVR